MSILSPTIFLSPPILFHFIYNKYHYLHNITLTLSFHFSFFSFHVHSWIIPSTYPISSVLMWAGLYALFASRNLGLTNLSLAKDTLGFTFGFIVLFLTQTVHSTAYTDDAPACAMYNSKHCLSYAFFEGIRALLSILGQTALWFFSWHFLEVAVIELHVIEIGQPTPHGFHGVKRMQYEVVSEIGSEGRLFQHLAYIGLGMLALVMTESVVSSSWIAIDDQDLFDSLPSRSYSTATTGPPPLLRYEATHRQSRNRALNVRPYSSARRAARSRQIDAENANDDDDDYVINGGDEAGEHVEMAYTSVEGEGGSNSQANRRVRFNSESKELSGTCGRSVEEVSFRWGRSVLALCGQVPHLCEQCVFIYIYIYI